MTGKRASGAFGDAETTEALAELLRTMAVPLMQLDEAKVYLVAASSSDVHLHLGGSYSGCPGVPYVERHLFAPLVAKIFPKAVLRVTSGRPLPTGARLLEPGAPTSSASRPPGATAPPSG